MKLGPALRRMMPPTLERKMSGLYRAAFVDLDKVAVRLAADLPKGARLLDIGGGDGELLNRLLDRREDLHVAMVDVAPSVGAFVHARHRPRVAMFPGTAVEAHVVGLDAAYDAALVSDVVHHLPHEYRADFLQAVSSALTPSGAIYVKDIEPGHFIAWLSLFCDRYVSGDLGVSLVSMVALRELGSLCLKPHSSNEIGLYSIDAPNYLVRFEFLSQKGGA